ncbi:hypothetical protein [Duffyella gerundensis]|uniref:hypothetical protein n=1 Tax=Duffyella gerundensis TaxID=1619313 RepID=UPI003F6E23D4
MPQTQPDFHHSPFVFVFRLSSFTSGDSDNSGSVFLGFGFWVLGFGFWVLGFGFWVLGFGFWVLGFGFWVLGFGFWVLFRISSLSFDFDLGFDL